MKSMFGIAYWTTPDNRPRPKRQASLRPLISNVLKRRLLHPMWILVIGLLFGGCHSASSAQARQIDAAWRKAETAFHRPLSESKANYASLQSQFNVIDPIGDKEGYAFAEYEKLRV